MKSLIFASTILMFASGATMAAAAQGTYIGSKACADCHDEQHSRFMQHSKKAHSWESVQKMAADLGEGEVKECYECHTTGYGKGGFVSKDDTPQFAEVGCETCHGPGSEHAETGDPELITLRPDIKTCERCHNSDRVDNFRYKPILYSGAH